MLYNLLSFNNLIRPEKIQFNYVNIGEVASTAVKKLDELSQSKNIRVIIENTNPSYVYGNTTALEQIAINIIKNAILYTQANGLVKVIVKPDYKGNVMLSVIDNGIGISEKDLNHIFEPFFRAEKSRNTKAGNVGLGLTIVSELVKLHNGKISVKSQLNTGTTVTVKIPYKEEASIEKNIYLGSEISIDYGTSL